VVAISKPRPIGVRAVLVSCSGVRSAAVAGGLRGEGENDEEQEEKEEDAVVDVDVKDEADNGKEQPCSFSFSFSKLVKAGMMFLMLGLLLSLLYR